MPADPEAAVLKLVIVALLFLLLARKIRPPFE